MEVAEHYQDSFNAVYQVYQDIYFLPLSPSPNTYVCTIHACELTDYIRLLVISIIKWI